MKLSLKQLRIRALAAIILPCFSVAKADQFPICGTAVTVDQALEVDEKNIKVTIFSETQILPRAEVPAAILRANLANLSSNNSAGKWKALFESCLRQKDKSSASSAFLLYALSDLELDPDYVESIFTDGNNQLELSKEIVLNKSFERLNKNIKYIFYLSIGSADIHWLRVNLIGKTMALTEDFRVFSEQKLTEALKVKKVALAKKISRMLELLYLSNAEKYKKYTLACTLIEEMLSSDKELNSSQLVTLVSIRNTDTSLRPLIDPFLIEGFQALAKLMIDKGKFDEALSMISSINIEQATPDTYNIISRIITAIDPASKILYNDTVTNLLLGSARNNAELSLNLSELYHKRTLKLLENFEIGAAHKSFENFKSISQDSSQIASLNLEFARQFLRSGNKEAAVKILEGTSPSFVGRFGLFIDGYYGNPLFYILFLLVPLVIKLSYEFFNKMKMPRSVQEEDPRERLEREQALARQRSKLFETNTPEEERSQFVSSSRVTKQKNQLFEEYRDCLSIFGLQEGSDLKTIKTAYRNAVRKIHPDLNTGNQTSEDAAKFVEFTKVYDRLRELHRLLGFTDK